MRWCETGDCGGLFGVCACRPCSPLARSCVVGESDCFGNNGTAFSRRIAARYGHHAAFVVLAVRPSTVRLPPSVQRGPGLHAHVRRNRGHSCHVDLEPRDFGGGPCRRMPRSPPIDDRCAVETGRAACDRGASARSRFGLDSVLHLERFDQLRDRCVRRVPVDRAHGVGPAQHAWCRFGFRLGLRDACHWRHPRSQCRPFREPLLDERRAGGGSGGGWYRVLPCRCHVGFSAALQFRENHQRRARERSACFGRQRR